MRLDPVTGRCCDELTERLKMHYLDQDTFSAALSDVWKRHSPSGGMAPDQLRESLMAKKISCAAHATSMDRKASIRFLDMKVSCKSYVRKIVEVQRAILEMTWPYQNNRSSIAGGS